MNDFEPASLEASLSIEENSPMYRVRTAVRGSTATEYGLVGALVLVGTVGVWLLFGNNLNQAFAQVNADMQAHSLVASIVKFGQALDHAGDVKTEDGSTIQAGGGYSLGGTPTQTAGTSGNTAEAYKALKALRDKAVKDGKMTEEEAANLDALAKQALRLASMQNAIENAMAQVGDNNELLPSLVIQFDGNPYTVSQLASMIGWKGNDSESGNPFIPDPAGGAELNALKNLYIEALRDGSLKDPQVLILVTQLTADVADFSDISQNAADAVEIPVPDTVQDQYEESVSEQTGGQQTGTSGSTASNAAEIGNANR